jgi:hypothetical protein
VIISALVLLLCHAPVAGQPQTGGPPGGLPASWKKTCDYGVQGAEGCTVKVEMKLSGDPCPGGTSLELCVKIKVACPADIPAGDPGDECEFEDCEVCPGDGSYYSVSVICDGLAFSVAPYPGMTWGDIAQDCSAGKITL